MFYDWELVPAEEELSVPNAALALGLLLFDVCRMVLHRILVPLAARPALGGLHYGLCIHEENLFIIRDQAI